MIQQRLFCENSPAISGLTLFEKDPHLMNHLEELMDGWQRAHPNLNVQREIAAAHSWQISHPARRKKCQAKFLTNWLNRAERMPAPATVDEVVRALQGAG